MKIRIHHQLSLPIGSGAARAVEHVLLTPLSGPTQTIREWTLDLPGLETAARFVDAFGNRVILVNQTRPEGDLVFAVDGIVETIDRNGVLGRVLGEPVVALFRRRTPLTTPDASFVDQFADHDRTGPARIALLHAIMEGLQARYRFGDAAAEPAADTPPTTQAQSQSMGGMTQSQGSDGQSQSLGSGDATEEPTPDSREPRDAAGFAHAFIATARALDIPARYIGGHLWRTDGATQQPAGHAWAEAYVPGLGWVGFDPANGICITDAHVRVSMGLDYLGAAPVRGTPSPYHTRPTAVVMPSTNTMPSSTRSTSG